MKLRYKIIFLLVVSFFMGGYIRKIIFKNPQISLSEVRNLRTKPINGSNILITVGGEKITSDDLKFEYDLLTTGSMNKDEKNLAIGLDGKKLVKLEDEILKGIVERKILYQFIMKDRTFLKNNSNKISDCKIKWERAIEGKLNKTFESSASRMKLKSRLCENALIKKFAVKKIFLSVKATKDEISDYYDKNRQKYKYPKRVTIRQIVLASDKEAKRVRYRTKRSNFKQNAEEYSITPESENGGLIGPFAKGTMPAVFDIAFRMRVGDISTVQKSTYGFHIILLIKKHKKTELSLAQVSKKIEEILLRKKQGEEYRKWINTALHTIKINTPTPLW